MTDKLSNLLRSRPYDGQPHTDHGERGKHEVCNITMRDLRDCFIRAVAQSTGPGEIYTESSKGEYAKISEGDLYKINFADLDIIAVQQNLTCEVEKIMGIFPNVPDGEDIARPLNPKSDLFSKDEIAELANRGWSFMQTGPNQWQWKMWDINGNTHHRGSERWKYDIERIRAKIDAASEEKEVWAPTLKIRWRQNKRMQNARVLQQQWLRTRGGPDCGGGSSEWRDIEVVTT